jgi:hypothetical protein
MTKKTVLVYEGAQYCSTGVCGPVFLSHFEMVPAEFLRLLTECNATIRQITKTDYGTVCAPSGGCGCGGTC